jgi:hypothetical protein
MIDVEKKNEFSPFKTQKKNTKLRNLKVLGNLKDANKEKHLRKKFLFLNTSK